MGSEVIEQRKELSKKSNLTEELTEWVRDLLNKYHIPGASVAVVDNDSVESAGYGFAQLPDVPATGDTIWRMASTSKAQTAAAMGLSPNGKQQALKWATHIREVLGDDFDLGNDLLTNSVTIEDSLSHRSGLSGHDLNYGPWLGGQPRDLTRSLRYLNPPVDHLRSQFKYCNAMYGVAGHILEKIDGADFEDIARKRLWGPLGMHNTFSNFTSSADVRQTFIRETENLARGYTWIEENEASSEWDESIKDKDVKRGYYVAEGHLDLSMIGPAGAVTSSVNDYSKWIQALLKAAQPPQKTAPSTAGDKAGQSAFDENDSHKCETTEQQLISHDLWIELTKPRTIVSPPLTMFPDINPSVELPEINAQMAALGWFTGNFMYSGQTIVHHSGGIHGFGSHVFLLPKSCFGVAIVGNSTLNANKLAEQVGRELIGGKLGISKDERRCEGDFAPKKQNLEKEDEKKPDEITVSDITGLAEKQDIPPATSTKALPEHFNLQLAVGSYHNGAHGKIVVTEASSAAIGFDKPTLEGVDIVGRNAKLGNKEKSEGAPSVNAQWALSAALQGARTLPSALVLHPPPVAATEAHTSKHVFLNLEKFFAGGTLTPDCVPNLPKGLGKEDDAKYPFRNVPVWRSTGIQPCAACFEYDGLGKVARLGMLLGNWESMEAGMKKGDMKDLPLEEFESLMTWFDRDARRT